MIIFLYLTLSIKLAPVESANKNAEEFKKYSVEKKMLEEDLKNYRFMKEVVSLEDFKAAIMKSAYWADEMAISILEKKLKASAGFKLALSELKASSLTTTTTTAQQYDSIVTPF